ncbi:hypothetical protein K474DRAFT_1774999 [Panus rudis PR-1116 ss-1]|nr:hypothetical protein K474DRAFT_1774999 [Panus rudis PR-1116 ss-1]
MPEATTHTAQGLLGGCVISIFVSFILYGLVVAQTYSYMIKFREDPRWLRTSVMILCGLETAYTICVMHWLYHMMILGFGELDIVDVIPGSATVSLILEVAIAVMVQSQYLRRLWLISRRNTWLVAPIAALLVIRIGLGMTTVAFLFILGRFSAFTVSFAPKATIDAANYIQSTADALIAGSLIYYLQRSKTGIAKTDGALQWIIQYVMNTGALTMAVSLGIAITFIALHNNLLFAGLFTIVSRLYANAFLGSLNGRHILRLASHPGSSTTEPTDEFSTYITAEPVLTRSFPRPASTIYRSRQMDVSQADDMKYPKDIHIVGETPAVV